MRRIKYGKHGIAEDPSGLHICLPWKGRELLGEVTGFERDPVTGSIRLTVQHFNGEDWPIQPVASVVHVLEQNEDDYNAIPWLRDELNALG